MENKQLVVPEQEEIIEVDGKNLIVSASAGSGKTSVMIRKISKHILSRDCSVEQLLVLTYTKTAAQEMKKKLVDKLRENVDNSPFLNDELELVQDSDISTFDSFCQKLVKRYFYVLNIDPSFNLLEGGEQNYQQGLAIDRAIRQLKKDKPEFYEVLLYHFSPKRDEEKIKEIIFSIYNYTTSILKIEDFFAKSCDFYEKKLKIAENYLNTYYTDYLLSIKRNLEELKKTSSDFEFNKYVLYINNLIINIERVLSEKSFSKKIDLIYEVEYGRLFQDKSDEIDFKTKIVKEKERLKKVFDSLKENFVSSKNVDNSYIECGKLCTAIFELLNIFIDKYNEIKKSINAYDFNDIERLTICLLEKDDICKEVKENYKYIFVDEFQDANAIQERIIFLLQNNNLFFVGDTKQSIYAFRQSDPEIFLNIEKNFLNDECSEAKTLNCNFRTNKNILNFVNKIFSVIMTEKTAGLDYYKKAQFVPKAQYLELNDEVNVSVNLINKREKEDKLQANEVYSVKENSINTSSRNEYDDECTFICEQVLLNLGKHIYDKDLQKERAVDFKDITILVSKRGNFLNTLCKHFTEVGIPYIVSANQNLEEMYDNIVLYNLLKYTENSKNDYALYTIASSPLFDFSLSELAYIKDKNLKSEFFYEAFEAFDEDGEIFNKIQRLKNVVSNFAFNIRYKGIYFSLSQILKESQYLLKISFEDDFQNRKINIEEYVNSFSGSKYDNSLTDYLIYRETALRGQKVQSERQSIDAVEITTMHSSKGLEYPIVILPNLDADNFKQPGDNEIKINKEFGIGLKAYNEEERTVSNGIFYESCKLKNRQIEQSEKIRLFYVAMTRAKNKLILVGRNAGNYKTFQDDYDILSTNNFLTLTIGALPIDVVERINRGETFNQSLFESDKLQLSVLNIEAISISQKEVVMPKVEHFEHIEKLSDFLNKNLKTLQKNIALKNSVSEFSFDNNQNSSINFAPQNMSIDEHLLHKASDRGTLYHKILELINFNNVNSESDVKQFINCNFSRDELDNVGGFDIENIYKNICLLKSYIPAKATVLKEQKFVMNIPYNQVVGGDIEDKILVQGIIDLLIIKDKEITLIDFKLTDKPNNYIRQKYRRQLELYEMAVSKGFKNARINKYILNLNKNEIIDI